MRISKYDVVFLTAIIAVGCAFFMNAPSPVFAQNPGPLFPTTNSAYVGAACGSNVAYLLGPSGRFLTCQSGILKDIGSGGVTASGTAAMGTSAITSGTCATVVTATATGTLTTDNILADFNADPTSTTGYEPGTSGMLTIIKYPTADAVNFKVCNNTSGDITPGAVTLNWRVIR